MSRWSARGFSLVELLVAMGLGGALVAAALSLLATSSQRHDEARALARLDERASFVFGVLEPELQMAGFGGLQLLSEARWPTSLPAGARACGTLASRPAPVRIASGMAALACEPHAGGAVEDAHVLVITRASGREAAPEPGRLQVLTQRASAGTQLVADGAALPVVAGERSLRNLVHAVYYVARSADAGAAAGPALRIAELTAIAGHAAFRDTEIADGIEDLRVNEGWRATATAEAPLRWSPAGERPADRPLEAVRVALLLRSERPIGAARTARYTLAGSTIERHDAYVRQVAVRDFTLRNLAARGLE